jgi:hypothetical protein
MCTTQNEGGEGERTGAASVVLTKGEELSSGQDVADPTANGDSKEKRVRNRFPDEPHEEGGFGD